MLLIFAVTLMIAVLLSALAHRTVLSTTVLFLAAGVMAGRGWFGPLPALTPALLQAVAELALFSVLFTDGMRAGGEAAPARTRPLVVRALAAGMPLTIAGIAALAHWLLGLTWVESILMGAVLSPTDPVFVSAIFQFKAVPPRLQRLLNIESGLNDGLALPVVIVFLSAMTSHSAQLGVVALQLAGGLAIGVVIPWLGIKLETSRFFGAYGALKQLHAFGLGLLVLAVAVRVDANIFLAAFAAGVMVARLSPDVHNAFAGFGEGVTELLKLAAILIFGLLMAPVLFQPISAAAVLFILLSLAAVRMAAIEIAMLGSGFGWSETLAAGWFGPKGFASVVYGLMILDLGTAPAQEMARLAGLTVVLSIVVYSSTDILVARWFERRAGGAPSLPA